MNEERSIGAFVGLSEWLPFEQQLGEILGYDGDKRTPLGDSNHEAYSNDGDMEDEDSTSNDSSSDTESDLSEGHESDLGEDLFQQPSPPQDDFDPFLNEDEDEVPLFIQAIEYVRDILDLPVASTDKQSSEGGQPISNLCQLQTPVFVGHGVEDPKVSVQLGEKMCRVLLTGLGMNVTWKAYQGPGHWYRVNDEIEDILKFLESHVKVPLEEVPLVRST
ncbi:Phospholipase/carboxylesterase/thioesterase [Penicillium waksmanii]|uniref:Phospholipase/carboxylesterase/thioesterase n=1 Tax=Penicillium waksmanii TaxID=69791 RepID=UPI0025494568|nr:Phospholipase/carboxylesterase/thioesterase [Penicillium waksmanii]KAJ5995714.1 Phospholipase/carboxylesterase/thioesterase [Penicillium waksmanii]